ncbi:MAG: DUF3800 domain-containing protein [Bacteroidales bacterium]|nr:DUF3800 domain-containing protein [Bacteroidales bacterium]
MVKKKKYFLFADECGDQCLSKYDANFPIFTLCGIIVSRDQARNLEKEMKDLKLKIWNDKGIILHSHEIRRHKNAFAILQDADARKLFYQELDRILGTNDAYVIVSSAVLKDEYIRKYGKLGDIYSQSLAFLLERAVFYVDDKNTGVGAYIEAMLERRGKEEDKTLSQSYNTLRETGTYWVSSERMSHPQAGLTKPCIRYNQEEYLCIRWKGTRHESLKMKRVTETVTLYRPTTAPLPERVKHHSKYRNNFEQTPSFLTQK